MNVIDFFIMELESETVSFNNYRKHEETLLSYHVKQPDTIHIKEIISFNSLSANKTAKFICKLADKYGIIITGRAKPFLVGPSTTQKNAFFQGMNFDRLLKWYKHYGFIFENDKIIRTPNENKN